MELFKDDVRIFKEDGSGDVGEDKIPSLLRGNETAVITALN